MVLKLDVRAAVLDAADELLGRFGYRKMAIADVARVAGIGKGTIYLHFSSKAELALAVIDRIVDRVVVRLEQIAESDDSVEDKLRQMLVTRVVDRFDAARHHFDSLDEMLAAIRLALLERRERWFVREALVFARVLREGVDAGELRVERVPECARDLLAATNAFLPYSLTVREIGRRKQIVEQVERIAGLLIGGLGA